MISEQTPARRGRPPREEIYARLAYQIEELWQRMGGLPNPLEAGDIWRGIWFEEAHHSTAIEGNTLVRRQVEALLAEGRAVGDKELREYLEVRGYADAADWVYRQASRPDSNRERSSLLTLTELREVHVALMAPVWEVAPPAAATEREAPGNFREHEVEQFLDGMKPLTWPLIPSAINEWLGDVNVLRPGEVFPEQMAKVHCRFEQIHPFLDGNGRAGRLLMNLLLVRLGYPPAIIYKRQRTDYLRALRRADSGDPGSLGELLARAILDNLYKFIVPAVAGPARLVPLAALATDQISSDALRVAAHRGRLQATRGADGQWRSCKNWVDDYVSGRYRREEAP